MGVELLARSGPRTGGVEVDDRWTAVSGTDVPRPSGGLITAVRSVVPGPGGRTVHRA